MLNVRGTSSEIATKHKQKHNLFDYYASTCKIQNNYLSRWQNVRANSPGLCSGHPHSDYLRYLAPYSRYFCHAYICMEHSTRQPLKHLDYNVQNYVGNPPRYTYAT